ncbi:MAG TPA: globin domain-containing protein [Candidatus Dormibacteraeota bacterium]|nr:globin domain-containing protein [Candidatus Dormibacteraeota bacterium]
MALDVVALRGSFGVVIERQPDLTHLFYEELFVRHPEARPLFSSRPMESQEQMLAETLIAALDHLEDPDWLRATLGELGRRHADYGVRPEMYGWVAEALLATLEKAAGDAWTPGYETAWRDALAAIADLMLAGYPATAT